MISDRFKVPAEQRVAQDQKCRRIGKASVKDLLDAENDLMKRTTRNRSPQRACP
jgi:hypothetical protein